MGDTNCPFCAITVAGEASASLHPRIIAQNQHAIVIRDGYPVTPGHTLIIPKRHMGSYFALSADEKNLNARFYC